MPAPLDGIKVIDFTRFQNGPHATLMLSDMGAQVIKVERPGEGDPGRLLGKGPDGFCAYFEALDRGKKSITVDLAAPEGAKIIRALVADADVLTENFRPGVLDSLGFGYDEMRELNPKLIYAVNSGFGPRGPWTDRGSFDIVSQGISGAMIGQAGGPGNEPVQIAWGLADQVGSMVFAYAIMTALLARERYGMGQRVDVSQMGAMATLQALSVQRFLHSNDEPTVKYINPTFTAYECSDGEWLTIGVLTPKHWPLMCIAVEREDLIIDERSGDPFARRDNAEWLRSELAASFLRGPRQKWLDGLIAQDVPCGPVYTYAQMAAEEQFWVNGYLQNLEHPNYPNHRVVGIPFELSETPGGIQGPAPELGQHTDEVLSQLGYDRDKIGALRDAGTI
ncbi:MAG: CoA transferase [Chloroflexi bacterium]|nr:CoA transferase [Chloroflexota bacterium]MDA1147839.1 CoA transferase [Chloroflexota bacterium]